MLAPLRDFQSLVLSGGPLPPMPTSGDHLLARVWNIVNGLMTSSTESGPGDLAALIRQSMLRAKLVLGEEPELRVPRTDGWPHHSDWQKFDCDVFDAGPQHYLVRPRSWSPSWLDPGAESVIDDAIAEID